MGVITTPSLLQVTVVAGPPVEVQVRVLDWWLTVRLVTLGEPEEIQAKNADEVVDWSLQTRLFTLQVGGT